jgi:drug/metabolite transporter (DMT)-like permease
MRLTLPADRRGPIDRYTFCGLLAILLWSTTIALARSLSEQIGPLNTAASVHLLAGGLCIGRLLSTGPLRKQVRSLSSSTLFGCGALFVGYMLMFYLAIGLAANREQVLEIGLINYLWCTFTIIFSLVVLNRKPNLLLVPGTLLALSGVVLVMTQGSAVTWSSFSHNVLTNPVAYSLALLAAVTWALYSTLTRRWATPGSANGALFFIPATGLLLLLLSLTVDEQGVWTTRAMIETAFLGVATTLAYLFWDVAMRKGDLLFVAASSYLTPLLSTLVACLYLRVSPGISLWIGCVFIMAGAFLSHRGVASELST